MESPSSFEGKGGRRNLLTALGSLALFSFLVKMVQSKKVVAQPPPAEGSIDRAPEQEGAIDCAPSSPKIAKMLTQDGRLVEVDLSKGRPVKKVTNEELRDWIKSEKL
jgi:hypothetical protein